MFGMMYPIWNPMIPNLMKLKNWHEEPPTIYSLLNSYVNFSKEEKIKISDLARAGRGAFFDFDYPLTDLITKEDFETLILNKFMMRRIGYETVTAFKLALNVKLNEIMPVYNKLFEALNGWNLFDGEKTVRDLTSNRNGESESNTTSETNVDGSINSISDRRFSNTPQNHIQDVKDGAYVSEYNYDTDNQTNSTDSNLSSKVTNESSDNGNEHEEVTHSVGDKLRIYQEFLQNRANIYSMIFKDLDELFYQVI